MFMHLVVLVFFESEVVCTSVASAYIFQLNQCGTLFYHMPIIVQVFKLHRATKIENKLHGAVIVSDVPGTVYRTSCFGGYYCSVCVELKNIPVEVAGFIVAAIIEISNAPIALLHIGGNRVFFCSVSELSSLLHEEASTIKKVSNEL
jgi:hypothetical protein